uniref:Uncharacterized protein n=1 Tax=Anopheles merus TaxID=30066 RepID=A0A182VGD9_ANOME
MLTSVPAGFGSFAGKTTSASGCGGGCSGSGPGPGGGGGGGGGPGGPGGRTSPSGLSTLTRMLISGLATATAASMASTIRKRIFCLRTAFVWAALALPLILPIPPSGTIRSINYKY